MKTRSGMLTLLSLLMLLALSACGTQTDLQPPTVDHATGFVLRIDPARETVTLVETSTPEGSHASGYLPSDTRILMPDEDIALKNLTYRFLSGNRLVMRLKVENITEGLTFEQPFFFTLDEDTSRIKSATAPLVTDRDLGGDGVLSPGERTRKLTFEVKHKGRPFTFLIDTSAVVTTEAVGKIAFTSDRDGNGEIYAVNADGTNLTNLTNHPASDYTPHWRPDGTQILYQSNRDSVEIFVMNADGSDPTNLTRNPTRDYEPTWSPDGSRIAFTSYRDGNREVYVMNADGSGPTNLTGDPAEDFEATWSPDGSKIAFRSNRDGNWEVYGMDADGANTVNLTNHEAGDSLPAWQPVPR